MRNRTAPPTAVAHGAPSAVPRPAQEDLVFGKVAEPGGDGPGARTQDVEMFDSAAPLPEGSRRARPHGRHGTGRPRHTRRAGKRRRAPREPEREKRFGMSLPLLFTGALAAGIGLTVGLTPKSQTPPNGASLTMPDLPALRETSDPAPALPARSADPTAPEVAPTTPGTVPTPSSTPPRDTTPPSPVVPPVRAAPTTPTPHRPASSATPASRPSEQSEVLALGSTGPGVVDLQHRLQQLYLYLGRADGTFGESVATALTRFQVARSIPEESGVYGPMSRAALLAETSRPERKGRGHRNGPHD
ncbi:peptidoglycan-binding domain-containing protein [Streptomyces sp. bgisy060]|uniref:peptidoglycan-binding domain-containing protein n=1 Tax=Streptomyces sp. bgisy060 TaxID=3413775 RepID=UPI003EB89775